MCLLFRARAGAKAGVMDILYDIFLLLVIIVSMSNSFYLKLY